MQTEKYPITSTENIPLKGIILDAGTQMRDATDETIIEEYTGVAKAAKKAEEPQPFPAVDVFSDPSSGAVILADGFKRYAAHKGAKLDEIKANIRLGTERDAILFAIGANNKHGERRSAGTLKNCVLALCKDPEWTKMSDRAMAEVIGCAPGTVANYRPAAAKPTTVVTKAGVSMDTSAIKSPEVAAKKAEEKQEEKVQKKAAKAAGKKPAKKAPAKKTEGTAAHALESEISIIERNVGGKEGKGVGESLRTGTLKLTPAAIKEWAGMKPNDQKWITPLVMERDFKPTAALELLTGEVSEKLLTEMLFRAMAGGGKATINQKVNGCGIRLTAEISKKR